jgi:phosphatidylserine decarboxylase
MIGQDFLLRDGMHSVRLKLFLQHTAPKKMLTVLAGLLANIKIAPIKNYLIRYFIRTYDVVMHEAVRESAEDYLNFNDFFTRVLKPGIRPVALVDVVSPVDGCVSEFGAIKAGQLIQAKGLDYSVDELLTGDIAEHHAFQTGSFITLYLSPRDYHRVHMPLAGVLQDMVHVPGTLFSVQPATTSRIPKLFARNERLVLLFETSVGPMALVLVGATLVGAIGTRWQGDLPRPKTCKSYKEDVRAFSDKSLKQADEVGYFKLGSTAILLFPKDVCWAPELKVGMSIRLGEALGEFLKVG